MMNWRAEKCLKDMLLPFYCEIKLSSCLREKLSWSQKHRFLSLESSKSCENYIIIFKFNLLKAIIVLKAFVVGFLSFVIFTKSPLEFVP